MPPAPFALALATVANAAAGLARRISIAKIPNRVLLLLRSIFERKIGGKYFRASKVKQTAS